MQSVMGNDISEDYLLGCILHSLSSFRKYKRTEYEFQIFRYVFTGCQTCSPLSLLCNIWDSLVSAVPYVVLLPKTSTCFSLLKRTNSTLKRNRNVSNIRNFPRIPLNSIPFSWKPMNNFIAYCNSVVSQMRLQQHRIRYCFETTKTLLETNIMFFVAGNTILSTLWFNGKKRYSCKPQSPNRDLLCVWYLHRYVHTGLEQ